ncbi:MAG: deoxyguanosinetriphosphate triphosphohydrolase [Clostridia bacterium]|nr:deoxyguanosinetriphosphate triphosphohydrolase [Clostridia bacterium]
MSDKKCVRELFYERERMTLSPYAFLCENTRGREKPIPPCINRTEFQRDRDRIVHSKSFRRLMHKTQVFMFPAGEHYRTRLTHTLEVSQIARIIARALMLNEDLCEASALGHDLGHTPFGHCGEEVMRDCFDPSFSHYQQSIRVVEKLENDGEGLNLTWEVRDAIVNHTGDHLASTNEGVIIKYADRIAYINHDIDDACRAGILKREDIPEKFIRILGKSHSARINTMVNSVIEASRNSPTIQIEPEIGEAMMGLRTFLFDRVYHNPSAKKEEVKARTMLESLFEYFVKYPEKMPEFYYKMQETEPLKRCVCDYISGMTDRYAIEMYKDLFIPQVWQLPGEL